MEELRALLRAVTDRHDGQAIVIDSVSGMGRSALLRAFEEQATVSDQARTSRIVSTQCHPGIGPGLMYGPVVDVLLKLGEAQGAKQRGVFRRMLGITGTAVARSAPEVLSAIVPGLGTVFTLGREVTQASIASGAMPFDSLLPFQQGAAVRIVEALLDLVRQGPPTVILIDDIQHIDPSSLLILDQLLRRLAHEPLGLVLSHATDGAYIGGPESMVEELLHRWATTGLLQRRTLSGLPLDAIAQLVEQRHPNAPSRLAAELAELTLGHAIFVTLCLDEWSPQHGENVPLPSSLSRVVDGRLRRLSEPDRNLLSIGATQGDTFFSRTVATVAQTPHEQVMERLRCIAHDHRLIVSEDLPGWARLERSDCYRFEHRALWGAVYAQQSPEQMHSRHARVAEALAAEDRQDAPLERRLEIARHLRHGGVACLTASADAHYALARDAAVEGLSFAEAERHCAEAIRAASDLPVNESRDRRFVQAVELLLSMTEVRWRGPHGLDDGPDIDALAAESEVAAERTGELGLQIRATLLRGKTLLATHGLEPSLAKLHAAVQLAEEHDDPVALFVARVEYGRQISKRRLADGLAELQEAERMYTADPRLSASADPVLRHARNLGEMQLGITLFDNGQLEEALTRLRCCVARLREEPLKAELPIALNYLAQVQAGLGGYVEAEATLREALEFEAHRGGDSGWHAYNTALLAHLQSQQPAHRTEALEAISQAWAETERTWLANLVPIVRNLYAEVLLDTAGSSPLHLDQARSLAVETCAETQRSGMIRSEIAAHSLLGRILLRQQDITAAEQHTRTALRILDGIGDMPALRTEEVQYHAAVVLHACGALAEALALLDQARRKMSNKANLITDNALKRRFLTEVPLNRCISSGIGVGA
ncbi:AAA family ATPase [Streptomyces sp. NPDC058954]|uniref:AAA family ATPase n=1 Tax=Streptomyces sp. NPDC058954 TaxID=3346677 RepID=UPI003694214C